MPGMIDSGVGTDAPLRLLLIAASDPGAQGDAAWGEWLIKADLDAITGPELELLPTIFSLRSRRKISLLPRVKGIFRRTWYLNQRTIEAARRGLAALERGGMEVLVFKGMAMIEAYGSPGARMMADADLLVRPQEFARAGEALVAEGFHPDPPTRTLRAGEKGRAFRNASGQCLDLHAFAMTEGLDEGCDDGFWRRSHPGAGPLHGARILDPADHLLLILVHGLWFSPSRSFRWMTDALHLCRHAPLDWNILRTETRERRLSSAAADGLTRLIPFGLEIPREIMEDLRRGGGRHERSEHRLRTTAPDGLLGVLPRLWALHQRERQRGLRPPRTFASFLKDAWGCGSWLELARTCARKARSRISATVLR